MARRRGRYNNTSGLVDYYNQNNGTAPDYGTPEYAARFDPSQAFGTPQPAGPLVKSPEQIALEAQQARGVQYADAQATYDRGRINRDFGFAADGSIDPNNPYSRAALLERSFQAGQRGDTNSYAAQGQLYSGALQNRRNSRAFSYLSDRNSLRNQYNDALGQTALNQLGAYTSAGGAVGSSQIDDLLRQLGIK